jgi:hypothetical protein
MFRVGKYKPNPPEIIVESVIAPMPEEPISEPVVDWKIEEGYDPK